MFKARIKPSEQDTAERRYEFHLGEAIRAALAGDGEKAAGHSGTALSISRHLYAATREPARYRPGLAAALVASARYQRAHQAVALLTESAGHYAALGQRDPGAYEVDQIDVLVRVALAVEASGNPADAIRLLREAVGMYRKVASGCEAARDAALARACFHLGRCLLRSGSACEGLAYIDEGLELAEALPGETRSDPGWLSSAPRAVQVLAPDWVAAATRAMVTHAAAGRWDAAAAAATAAVRVSGGLAALGSDERREAHVAIIARARAIWARARAIGADSDWPEAARAEAGLAQAGHGAGAAQSSCDWRALASANRLRDRSTSASAAVRSVQWAPSTDLPGSRSL
jgi:hypothetical protein